jgi:hypothetical protein
MFKEIKVDPVQLKAALDARQQIRAGFDQPTAGMAAGMTGHMTSCCTHSVIHKAVLC